MRLSVATNFDPRLLEALEGYPVYEVFGKLPRDFVGGGRASYMLSPVSRRSLAEHVAQAHRRGIQFNYLLNAACLNNLEWTGRGQREIERLLAWLARIGVDSITVSLPHLLELIKRRYPQFRVKVGVFAGVDGVQKAKWWEDLGADGITLASLAVNRNFSLLAAIRRSVACELQLLVNTNCLQACPLASAHMVALSHASQAGHAAGGFLIDYCFLKCTQMKLREPVNYIRSDWIRPEDLHHYQALGYDRFKIAERNAPTEVMVRRVKAYTEGRYDGNLLDLVQGYGFACGNSAGASTGISGPSSARFSSTPSGFSGSGGSRRRRGCFPPSRGSPRSLSRIGPWTASLTFSSALIAGTGTARRAGTATRSPRRWFESPPGFGARA